VSCDGKDSCQDASIICPAAQQACEVRCEGEHACEKASIVCRAGPCLIDCAAGKDVCKELHVECGFNQTDVSCTEESGRVNLEPNPDSACGCTLSEQCATERD
jgi:hypothetical protein